MSEWKEDGGNPDREATIIWRVAIPDEADDAKLSGVVCRYFPTIREAKEGARTLAAAHPSPVTITRIGLARKCGPRRALCHALNRLDENAIPLWMWQSMKKRAADEKAAPCAGP